MCVEGRGGIETLSRLPLSSQLQSAPPPQLFGLWAPSPTPLVTLAGVWQIETYRPNSVILWVWGA